MMLYFLPSVAALLLWAAPSCAQQQAPSFYTKIGGTEFVCRPLAGGREKRCCLLHSPHLTLDKRCVDILHVPVPVPVPVRTPPQSRSESAASILAAEYANGRIRLPQLQPLDLAASAAPPLPPPSRVPPLPQRAAQPTQALLVEYRPPPPIPESPRSAETQGRVAAPKRTRFESATGFNGHTDAPAPPPPSAYQPRENRQGQQGPQQGHPRPRSYPQPQFGRRQVAFTRPTYQQQPHYRPQTQPQQQYFAQEQSEFVPRNQQPYPNSGGPQSVLDVFGHRVDNPRPHPAAAFSQRPLPPLPQPQLPRPRPGGFLPPDDPIEPFSSGGSLGGLSEFELGNGGGGVFTNVQAIPTNHNQRLPAAFRPDPHNLHSSQGNGGNAIYSPSPSSQLYPQKFAPRTPRPSGTAKEFIQPSPLSAAFDGRHGARAPPRIDPLPLAANRPPFRLVNPAPSPSHGRIPPTPTPLRPTPTPLRATPTPQRAATPEPRAPYRSFRPSPRSFRPNPAQLSLLERSLQPLDFAGTPVTELPPRLGGPGPARPNAAQLNSAQGFFPGESGLGNHVTPGSGFGFESGGEDLFGDKWDERSSESDVKSRAQGPPPTQPPQDVVDSSSGGSSGEFSPWPPVEGGLLPGRVPCRRPWGCRPDKIVTHAPESVEERRRTAAPRRESTEADRVDHAQPPPRPTRTTRVPPLTPPPLPLPPPPPPPSPPRRQTQTRRPRPTSRGRSPERRQQTERPRKNIIGDSKERARPTFQTSKSKEHTAALQPRVLDPPVEISFPQAPPNTNCYLDLMFVVDASGSLKDRFQQELELAADVVDRLEIGENQAKVSLIKFAGPAKARVIFGFNDFTDKRDIKDAIYALRHSSGITETAGALDLAAEQFEAARGSRIGRVKPVAIVFTDGFSSTDPMEAAAKLLDKGVLVYAIAVSGGARDNFELARISGHPDRVFTDESFTRFKAELGRLTGDCAGPLRL